jgi:molybdopterin-guanine dinucleotide biosynthesis protein A
MQPKLTAIILAGGASTRMGRDKAWLDWQGQSFLVHAVRRVQAAGAGEIFISGRPGMDYSALQLPVLVDLEPNLGPLGGIERGLAAAASPLVLFSAVDMPHLTTEFLAQLISHCEPNLGCVPMLPGGWEPLVAVYPTRAHPIVTDLLAEGRRSARAFAERCHEHGLIRPWPVPHHFQACCTNCNSPADLPPLP